MNLRSKWCLYGLLSWASMTGIGYAQQPLGAVRVGAASAEQLPPPLTSMTESPGQVSLGNGSDMGYLSVDRQFRPRFNIDTRGGGLYGYNPGYTNIGMFMPFAIEGDSSILFLDARGMVTHEGGGGANVGLGWRSWIPEIDRVVGLSVFYDNDNGHVKNYNQIGLSFESLGRYVDYRVNGYIPIGTRANMLSSTVDPDDTLFMGNDLVFRRTNVEEQTYTGFDAEMGGPLPVIGRYGVNGYAGGYYFLGNGITAGTVTGASGRFMAQINEDVSFGVQWTHDNVFGTNTQFQVFVQLPEGMPSRWLRNPRVQDRLTQSVFRQGRVMANIETFSTFDQAIDPKDGLPYFVTHIDPNATGPGDGTFENPFSSVANYNAQGLADQQQSDIISVRRNLNDLINDPNLDTGPTFTLYDGQRLLSTSVQHTFLADNFPGVPLDLPDPTGVIANEPLPLLWNSSGGDVITLAPGAGNGVEVSGFDITGSAGGNGIAGSNNSWVLINRNVIHDAFNGVNLVNLADGLNPSVIDNNVLRDNVNDGFHLLNIGGTSITTLEVTNNLAYGNGDDGFDIAADAGSTVGGLIDGNSTVPPIGGNQNGDDGLALSSIGGTLAFNVAPDQQISNNNFSNNQGDGVLVDVTLGGNTDLLFIGNTIANNSNAGINVPTSDASLINLVIGGPDDVLDRNTITGNVGPGILFDLSNTANGLTATIENNLISGNQDGIQVNVADTASFGPGTTIFDNEITGNIRDGIRLTRSDSGVLDLGSPAAPPIHDNDISGNLQNGLTLIVSGDNSAPIELATEDNIFDSNGQDGLSITAGVSGGAVDNPDVAFDSNRDQFTSNGRHGLNLVTNDLANLVTNLVNVTANSNAQNGLNTISNDGDAALATGQIINVFSPVDPLYNGTSTFSSNGGDGISNTSNFRSLTVVNLNPLNETQIELNSNGDAGWSLNRFDASLIVATAQNTTFNDNGSNGIEFNYTGSPPTDPNQPLAGTPNLLTLNNVQVDANGSNGLFTHGAGDATLLASVTTSQFNNNALNGILIQTDLGSSFGESAASRSTFDGITANGNGGDGVHVDSNFFLVTGSNVFLEINTDSANTDISNNLDDGVHVESNGLTSDILVQATAGNQLSISNNAVNGIRWDVTSTLPGNSQQFVVDDVIIDGNGNDGVQFNAPTGDGVMTVDNSDITNNGGDGININVTALGSPNVAASGSATMSATLNNIDGNQGHGINVQVQGSLIRSLFTVGPQVFGTFDQNQIVNSGLNGVNVELRGHTGLRGSENEIEITNSRIASNGTLGIVGQTNGIFVQQDAGAINGFRQTTRVIDPPAAGGQAVPGNLIGEPDFNAGFATGIPFLSNFMNLRTENNLALQILSNNIEFNGPSPGAPGEGVFLRVSTLGYMSADVSGNTFTGNGSSDFRTESFIATGQTNPPNTTSATNPAADIVFLDDTAQMDLLLSSNSGQNIQPISSGAFYGPDPLKQNGIARNVQLFQVDNSGGVLDLNNFTNLPVPLESTLFSNADFFITTTPFVITNPAFPEDSITDFGDPFLP